MSKLKSEASEVTRVRKISTDIQVVMKEINCAKISMNSNFPIHLAFGHEILAACCAIVKDKGDKFCLTHRNIHFNIALSEPSHHSRIVEEAIVSKEGLNSGQFGCMSMRNIDAGVAYSSSILANNLPVGLGISSTLESGSVCWIQTGDGAIEEGCFYESLVFARARDLPCLVLVENNNWSLGTSVLERRKSIDLEMLGSSVGFPYYLIDKNDPIETILGILKRARRKAKHGPVVVEAIVKTEGGKYDPDRGYVSYHHGPISD